MRLRILKGSLWNQRRAFAMALLSAVMGTAIVASLLAVSLQVSGRIARELRRYGANLLVEPAGPGASFLREEDLFKVKLIFWRHNVAGFMPYLYGQVDVSTPARRERAILVGTWFKKPLPLLEGGTFEAGLQPLAAGWQVRGRWAGDEEPGAAMVGFALAKRLGLGPAGRLEVHSGDRRVTLKAVGLVATGSSEDEQVFVSLPVAQELLGLPGRISTARVSAITVPLDDLGRRSPQTLSRRELEKWYCTPYVTSIARQLEEVFQGGRARPLWRIVEAEGKVFSRLKLLFLCLILLALAAGTLAVATTLTAGVLRRQKEIGLLKALGADNLQISLLFSAEAAALGVLSGLLGYLVGLPLSHYIGWAIFGSAFDLGLSLLPVALSTSLGVAFLGSLLPLRKALEVEPAAILRG